MRSGEGILTAEDVRWATRAVYTPAWATAASLPPAIGVLLPEDVFEIVCDREAAVSHALGQDVRARGASPETAPSRICQACKASQCVFLFPLPRL